jgi:hypothetical protein
MQAGQQTNLANEGEALYLAVNPHLFYLRQIADILCRTLRRVPSPTRSSLITRQGPCKTSQPVYDERILQKVFPQCTIQPQDFSVRTNISLYRAPTAQNFRTSSSLYFSSQKVYSNVTVVLEMGGVSRGDTTLHRLGL